MAPGTTPPRTPLNVTISDVARAAGVSKMTVSNVINGRRGVRTATRERVEAAIRATGYQPNPLARMLAGGLRGLIGVVAPNLALAYVGLIIQGASEAAEASGQNLALFSVPPGARLDDARRALLRHLTGGAILVLPTDEDLLADLPGPLVSLDGPGPHQLRVNHRQGALAATEHLLALGHTRIAHIAGPAEHPWNHAERRLSGYRAALRAAGIAPRPEYLRRGTFGEASGHAAATSLLSLPQPPSAIFAANDLMAIGAVHAAQDLGLQVPRDLSVVGFDDLPAAVALRPGLTTVRQPLHQLGADALRMVLRAASGERLPARVSYPTELVVRESTAPPGP